MRLARARELLGNMKASARAGAGAGRECAVSFDQRGLEESGRLRPRGAAAASSVGAPPALGEKRLDGIIADLHRLHPVGTVLAREGGLTLFFKEPVPWPLFLRLDLAKPFGPSAGELCRRLAGLSVESVSLARERMEIRVV